MTTKEKAIVFKCNGQHLIGIVHGAGAGASGVLVIVGGPQYRVGSHRQFLLLARHLAASQIPVMRFDYRGMGDAEGEIRTFEEVGDDIRAAIDAFFEASPQLRSIALWGLCDAASAALFYAHTDPRVERLILLNPWVRTAAGEAKAYLRHYYLQRLFDRDFWRKVASGRFEIRKSLASLLAFAGRSQEKAATPSGMEKDSCGSAPLPERMYEGLAGFHGPVGIIISGDDLTAAEFEDLVRGSRAWRKLLRAKGVEFHHLPDANHTFSRQVWRDQVAQQTLRWMTETP